LIALLGKLHYSDLFYTTFEKIFKYNYTNNYFAEFKSRIGNMPFREIERLDKLDKIRLSKISTSHPPTMYRIKHIQSLTEEEPGIQMDPEQAARLDNELQPEYKKVNKGIVEFYKEVY